MGGSLSHPADRRLADNDELEAPYHNADPSIRRAPPSAAAAPAPANNNDNAQPPLPFLSFQQSLMASLSPGLPLNLNLPASSSVTPFPRLTLQQLAQLRDNGVDMDLCFVPHQMPRLTAHHLDEEGKEREKRCVKIDNCMAVSQLTLVSPSASASTSTTPSSSAAPSPDSLSLSFLVDSRVPCRVSIYPAATEVIDRNVSDQPPVFTAQAQCHLWTQTLPAGLHQPVAVPLASLLPVDVLNRAVASSASSSAAGGGSTSFPSLFTYSSSRHYYPLIVHCENMSYQSSSSGLLPSSSSSQHKRRDEQKERVALDIDTPPAVDHLIQYLLFTKHQPASNAAAPPSQSPNSATASSTAASASPAPSPTAASDPSAHVPPSASAAAVGAATGPAVLGVKRLKQKIKLQHNKSYELFDLYGLREQPRPDAAAATQASAASQESPDCVICLTNKRTHAIFPCRHVCLCADCSVQLREQTNRCPICRRMVETVIPILPEEAEAVGDDDSVAAAAGGGGGREGVRSALIA